MHVMYYSSTAIYISKFTQTKKNFFVDKKNDLDQLY